MKKQYSILLILLFTFGVCSAQVFIIANSKHTWKAKETFAAKNVLGNNEQIAKNEHLIFTGNNPRGMSFSRLDGTKFTVVGDNVKQSFLSSTGGAITFPFKIRMQRNSPLEPSLSLSGLVGLQHSFNKEGTTSLRILIGIGPSSITVDKTNSSDSASETKSAATFSLTALAQWDNVQLGISFGMDQNLDNRTDKWIYQSKPWIGLSIGINISGGSSQ